ncbi:DUF2251 domain-containing protein [Novosphingobium sp.]|uniref:DUF2251 domain-containing protein n=1 Tax=Novosphingobium sp. TaxID=1874826 RepID=UPI0025EADCA0|nr:DUF2251 domain-containing protein [Novosphingobium sp.]
MVDVYESSVEAAGRFGSVFERDEETAFFYLLDLHKREGNQIVGTFRADIVNSMPVDVPVSIRWNSSGTATGLFVNGRLLAIFDLQADELKARYANGGDDDLFRSH